MMNRNTQSKREKIYRSSPELKKIIDECGNQSLTEYVSRHVQYICPVSEDRQREFASAISLLIDFKASSNGVVSDVHTQLKKNWSVSTADHQGPATHPFFVSAQFLRQRALASSSNLLALTLPCAGISMSNSSFPRGIQFHDEFMREHRLSFVGWRDRNISVYAAKQYDKSDYEKVLETLHSLKLSNTLEQQVESLLASVFEPSASFSGTYDAQMSVVNNRLGAITKEELAFQSYYISMERITVKLLSMYHSSGTTALSRLFCDEESLILFSKYFDGVRGAFNTREKKGTFLFWGLVKGKRISLHYEHGALVNTDFEFMIPCRNVDIEKACLELRLMPSMALCFVTLAFYYGLVCGGGFSQVTYLRRMKESYQCYLADLGYVEEKSIVDAVSTSLISGDVLAALFDDGNTPVTGIDLLLPIHETRLRDLDERMNRVTLSDAVTAMLNTYTL